MGKSCINYGGFLLAMFDVQRVMIMCSSFVIQPRVPFLGFRGSLTTLIPRWNSKATVSNSNCTNNLQPTKRFPIMFNFSAQKTHKHKKKPKHVASQEKNSIPNCRPGRKNAWFLLFGFCGAVFVLGRFRLAHHGLCWQMRFQLQHQLRAQRFGHAHRVGKCDRMAHGIGAGCAWEEPCEALKVTPPVWAWSLPRPTTKGSLIVR